MTVKIEVVVDEKKTAKLMKDREESVKQNAINKENNSVGQGDMVKAIVNLGNMVQGQVGSNPEQKAFKDMSLKELKIYCIENDIEHHPSALEANIIGKIEDSQKQA